MIEITISFSVIVGIYAWERWRVRQIHEEMDELRRETHEIFDDLKESVEHCHDE